MPWVEIDPQLRRRSKLLGSAIYSAAFKLLNSSKIRAVLFIWEFEMLAFFFCWLGEIFKNASEHFCFHLVILCGYVNEVLARINLHI